MGWTLFEYMYRDAGNFKALGSVALEGALTPEEQEIAWSCFPPDELFVAEQLDVPPLYEKLYRWSGGPTSSDHCWHEFLGFRTVNNESEVPSDAQRWGAAKAFVERLTSIEVWKCELSPHFALTI
jgi:hypothetical protein